MKLVNQLLAPRFPPRRASYLVVVCVLTISSCGNERASSGRASTDSTRAPAANIQVQDQPQDSVIVEERLAWARAQRLDTLPTGQIMAHLGRTFVGAPYTPGTLDVEGPEQLVVNLREFDCVTFVETAMALARVVRAGSGGYNAFKNELLRIRYRAGQLDGYPSRLHYFSEWIADNESMGFVTDITRALGGIRDGEAINFMSHHSSAYRQLSDSTTLSDIRNIEQQLSSRPRYVIPEDRIAAVADSIHDGDVIAAASTLPGLDIAHTGLALWVDGKLHLMHAPLVGKSVEISDKPLAQRIQSIGTQDGIMVARPR